MGETAISNEEMEEILRLGPGEILLKLKTMEKDVALEVLKEINHDLFCSLILEMTIDQLLWVIKMRPSNKKVKEVFEVLNLRTEEIEADHGLRGKVVKTMIMVRENKDYSSYIRGKLATPLYEKWRHKE